ncbi:MAG: hypothetical protein ROO73_04580 [Roseivirga sp.]
MQKRYTHALLRSALALLLLATSCGQKENTPPPAKEEKKAKITRADTPGTLPVSGTLEYKEFATISTCYLLAACEGPSPFSEEYNDHNIREDRFRNFFPTFSQPLEAIITYIRTGGGEEQKQDIQNQFDLLFKSPLKEGVVLGPWGTLGNSVPSFGTMQHRPYLFAQRVHSVALTFEATHVSQPSMKTLFEEKAQKVSGSVVKTQLSDLLFCQYPPANFLTRVSDNTHPETDKTITISPSITLPAACNGEKKDIEYKLVGAWIEKRSKKKKTVSTGTSDDLEAITYFRWNNQWYKLTNSNLTPQTVPEAEISETGNPTDYDYITQYRYLYTINDSAS